MRPKPPSPTERGLSFQKKRPPTQAAFLGFASVLKSGFPNPSIVKAYYGSARAAKPKPAVLCGIFVGVVPKAHRGNVYTFGADEEFVGRPCVRSRLRGHRVQAARFALSWWAFASLAERQEPGSAGCKARG